MLPTHTESASKLLPKGWIIPVLQNKVNDINVFIVQMCQYSRSQIFYKHKSSMLTSPRN